MAPRLSKSRYVAGLQCEKRLWLMAHEPGAPELQADERLQNVFSWGHRVGERAQQEFVGGVLIELDYRRRWEAVEATRAAIEAGEMVIYEASFEHDGVFAAVDILHRADGDDGWTLTEVKSTLSAKGTHVADCALQTHVLRGAGIDVTRVELMHLNRDHRHPDVEPLFIRADITEAVEAELREVPARLVDMKRTLRSRRLPVVEAGDQCFSPYECAFVGRCHGEETAPLHTVDELYGHRYGKADKLRADGITDIADIPDDYPLWGAAARQRRAVRSGEMVVDPGLSDALAALERPFAHLDFETIGTPLPEHSGVGPWQQVAVQFSAHLERADGTHDHVAFLQETPGDARQALARRMLDATVGAGTVFAWHAPFEHDRIMELAEALPSMREELHGLADRLVDLLPIVRNHVYHPDFRGSFSLKRVLPALVPALAYDDLSIACGGDATVELESVVLGGDVRDGLREDLLAYCERDTLALVEILALLRRLAVEHDRCASAAERS